MTDKEAEVFFYTAIKHVIETIGITEFKKCEFFIGN